MSRVLDVAKAQLGVLECGHPPDATLLQLVADYFAGYSDACHHPKEDLVFRKLRARAPEVAEQLADLLREHRELREVSLELAGQVEQLWGGSGDATPALAEALERFLRAHRRHMEAEEREFFPTVARTLTAEDLAEIEFHVLDRPDPLVDPKVEARFKYLRDEIDRRADTAVYAAERSSAEGRADEAALLLGSSDVARFNALWSQRGIRLVRLAAGGYSLERDGTQLVNVPDCSEQRAVWCALFFLKGERTTSVRTGAGRAPEPARSAATPTRQARSTAR